MRKATSRITLRFTSAELDEVHEAIRWGPQPWRGMSFHIRQAILEWAHRQLTAAKKKRRAS